MGPGRHSWRRPALLDKTRYRQAGTVGVRVGAPPPLSASSIIRLEITCDLSEGRTAGSARYVVSGRRSSVRPVRASPYRASRTRKTIPFGAAASFIIPAYSRSGTTRDGVTSALPTASSASRLPLFREPENRKRASLSTQYIHRWRAETKLH